MNKPLTIAQISAFRLRRHHLANETPPEIAGICRDLCGIQAQVTSAAQMSLWARSHLLKRAEIDDALYRDRTLVKTNCMRATLHFLNAADYPYYVAGLRAGRLRQFSTLLQRYSVPEDEALAVKAMALELLAEGPMTRRALTQTAMRRVRVSKKARFWFERSWWGVVHRAIVEGDVCYGDERGRDILLVRTAQWLPKMKRVSDAEGLAFLLRRYLAAYGPATLRDFAKWAGLPSELAQAAGEALKEETAGVEAEGRRALILQRDEEELRHSALTNHHICLLPHFDTYLLGHLEKDHLIHDRFYKRVYRNQGWISPVVLLNGRVIGVWAIQKKGKQRAVEVEPLESFSKAARAGVEEEVASLGQFLESKLEVKYKK